MAEKIDFQKLIKTDRYQVFIFSSPAAFPINFAKHPWFVLNEKGVLSRWEIFHFKNKVERGFNFLHLNTFPLFRGFAIFYPFGKHFWKPELLGFIEGEDDSSANKAISFIKDSKNTYPFCDKYYFWPGPNSNTYAQNILNHFPEFNVVLSWRFIGKGYRIEKR